jgi:hypothetical protein
LWDCTAQRQKSETAQGNMADAFSAFWQSSRHLSGLKINRPCGKIHLLLRDAAREGIQSALSVAVAKAFIDRTRAAISRRFAIASAE